MSSGTSVGFPRTMVYTPVSVRFLLEVFIGSYRPPYKVSQQHLVISSTVYISIDNTWAQRMRANALSGHRAQGRGRHKNLPYGNHAPQRPIYLRRSWPPCNSIRIDVDIKLTRRASVTFSQNKETLKLDIENPTHLVNVITRCTHHIDSNILPSTPERTKAWLNLKRYGKQLDYQNKDVPAPSNPPAMIRHRNHTEDRTTGSRGISASFRSQRSQTPFRSILRPFSPWALAMFPIISGGVHYPVTTTLASASRSKNGEALSQEGESPRTALQFQCIAGLEGRRLDSGWKGDRRYYRPELNALVETSTREGWVFEPKEGDRISSNVEFILSTLLWIEDHLSSHLESKHREFKREVPRQWHTPRLWRVGVTEDERLECFGRER
ncbi:hypothetical protein BS47DRAFT_1389577 [Hydnum rufescens UP504]|uniref:Uncharacterized protein n=1 Tax=Hydnum rufescens UP504 TaxID=1448309 RepID=A0A9P6DXW5_9AGAM|nr:hypothetical protein BS47DRAFT_1389577 [Hydnum rufescens UP504]